MKISIGETKYLRIQENGNLEHVVFKVNGGYILGTFNILTVKGKRIPLLKDYKFFLSFKALQNELKGLNVHVDEKIFER